MPCTVSIIIWGAQVETLRSQVFIEEYATIYIAQVIEFAQRCFDMAARLAKEAVTKHKLKRQGKRDNADKDVNKKNNTVDKELDDLQNEIIECNEECGLLLFNVLQEFSLTKEANRALFPHEVYSHHRRHASILPKRVGSLRVQGRCSRSSLSSALHDRQDSEEKALVRTSPARTV